MLPEIQYFRFNPVDERCGMELDETDPAIWLKLEAATEEYIQNNHQAFKNVCERLLLPFQNEGKWLEKLKPQHFHKSKILSTVTDENSPSLGRRRMVLLVEASHSPDSGRIVHHARSLETFCARSGIRLSIVNRIAGFSNAVPATTFPTPSTSPLFTGSFPSSPLPFSPAVGCRRGASGNGLSENSSGCGLSVWRCKRSSFVTLCEGALRGKCYTSFST